MHGNSFCFSRLIIYRRTIILLTIWLSALALPANAQFKPAIEGDTINNNKYYTGLRISLGMQTPLGKPDFPEYYDGFAFYLNVGMGGLSRNYQKK